MSVKLETLKIASHGPKVDHPLAKYNSRGDLFCLLCKTLIKNANVWKAHLSTKSHKDTMILFKSGRLPSTGQQQSIPKRKNDSVPAPPRSLKKMKISDDTHSTSESPKQTSSQKNPGEVKTGILKQSSRVTPKLPEGFIPKSKQIPSKTVSENSVEKLRAVEAKSNLPTGFFDDSICPTEEVEGDIEMEEPEDEKKKVGPSSALPDGFFDDAREDAKARKIEYKDPKQVEWEKFQNEMEQEDIRYNLIIEEDDQKLREERDFDIGIEQKLWDYRVESIATSAKNGEICIGDMKTFEVKIGKIEEKEEVVIKSETVSVDVKIEEAPESESEEDDDMDWRTKKGYKIY